MATQQIFEVVISGDRIPGKDLEVFLRQLDKKVLVVDPEVQIEIFKFSEIGFRVRWFGIPKVLSYVDTLHRYAVKYSNEYFIMWDLSIVIKYHEKEVV